jgi:uncharacterized membrane protein YbhN (UPF0104 family)
LAAAGARHGARPAAIAGFTAAGIPQSEAVAAVFIERICAAYLPPVYGWVTLVFMRRREYV